MSHHGGQASPLPCEASSVTHSQVPEEETEAERGVTCTRSQTNQGHTHSLWPCRAGVHPPCASPSTETGWRWGCEETQRIRVELSGEEPPPSGTLSPSPGSAGHSRTVRAGEFLSLRMEPRPGVEAWLQEGQSQLCLRRRFISHKLPGRTGDFVREVNWTGLQVTGHDWWLLTDFSASFQQGCPRSSGHRAPRAGGLCQSPGPAPTTSKGSSPQLHHLPACPTPLCALAQPSSPREQGTSSGNPSSINPGRGHPGLRNPTPLSDQLCHFASLHWNSLRSLSRTQTVPHPPVIPRSLWPLPPPQEALGPSAQASPGFSVFTASLGPW